ncbi:MFS transporter [Kitasatospora sp. NPDC048540]|uniref:MFS transporter n=1 Tax=Kitasatospora sp. NPDC048540 TaxID=3155634 RepID=UPI0033C370B9
MPTATPTGTRIPPPAPAAAPAVKFPLRGLPVLFAAAFCAVMTELLPAGLLPGLSHGLHVSEARAGYLVTGYAAASFLAAIPVTAALRGTRRRRVLVGALLAFALADTVTALSANYPLTFAARLLAGATGGVLWAMLAGYAARMVPAEHRGRAIAIVLAGITVALALGIPAGTALAALTGWRAVFGALAALALLLAAAAGVLHRVPDFPGEPAAERVALRRIAVILGLRTVLTVTLLLLLGHQAMYTYLVPFAARAGFGAAGGLLAVFGLATIAGIVAGGALADRRLRPTLLTGLALIPAALLALGLSRGEPAVTVAAVAGWGAAFGAAPTMLQTALIDLSGPRHADLATALQATVYNLGIAAGSLTGGLALGAAGPGALPWTALPPAAAATAVVALARRHAFPARRPVHGRPATARR